MNGVTGFACRYKIGFLGDRELGLYWGCAAAQLTKAPGAKTSQTAWKGIRVSVRPYFCSSRAEYVTAIQI